MKAVDETIGKLESVFSSNITDIQQLKDKLGSRKDGSTGRRLEGRSSEFSFWEEHFSEEYQIPYYFNPQTGESSWEVPADYLKIVEAPLNTVSSESEGQKSQSAVLQIRDKQHHQQQPTIADRSIQQIQARKEREDSYREYLDRKRLQEVKSKPEITSKSKNLQRDVHDMFSWEESRKIKLAQRQQEVSEEILAQNTGRPKVTKVAQKLAQNQQHLPVEERLLDYEVLIQLYKLSTWCI